jgi:F-type H+-transporting ATPase subunit delta
MAEAITIARPYAAAVFRLAKEKNALSRWSDMLSFLAALARDPQVQTLIDDPKLAAADLERLFLDFGANKLDEQAVNLVKVLVEYGRLAILPEISAAFEQLKTDDEGTLEAEITAAAQPSDVQVNTVVQQLQIRFGKKINARVQLDPALIGGLKIVIGDTVIDASVRGQLQELAYSLKA